MMSLRFVLNFCSHPCLQNAACRGCMCGFTCQSRGAKKERQTATRMTTWYSSHVVISGCLNSSVHNGTCRCGPCIMWRVCIAKRPSATITRISCSLFFHDLFSPSLSLFFSNLSHILFVYAHLLLLLRRWDCGNYCGCLHFFTSQERRHTLQIGSVSIGVHDRRVPGQIFALKCPNWLSKWWPLESSRSSLMVLL
jgi:hypothetical protein